MGGECEILPRGYAAAATLAHRVGRSSSGSLQCLSIHRLNKPIATGFKSESLMPDMMRFAWIVSSTRTESPTKLLLKSGQLHSSCRLYRASGGDYFEAGFTLGLDLPVIWTCRKNDMGGLHFAIRQFNTIDWEEPTELAWRLRRRIEATLGKGPGPYWTLEHPPTVRDQHGPDTTLPPIADKRSAPFFLDG